ncbi:hypothetical protein AZI87_09710 [Bdellovibrio bacteriovorus]|uniref:Uncharacterized protein n=1 Tax=Bdellovibrio bacteriovorus TaxID=959 RepID=A0A162H1Q0_BDEBC|nr:hypothetical protein [Bdellovibrio bacteriovorus]KYG69447.1 hypothetical protein AZI87_09710 [Bdellovibrio bacteriovorus]
MERFKVSGQELRDFYKENIVLGKVFTDIENDLRSTNQVVCRYIVNGLEINETEEARFATVPLEQIDTLEYLTENSRDLTSIVLKGWIDALPELIQSTENLAKRMRVQGLSGLLKPIHDLVQNCEFLIDSTMTVKEMMGDQFLVSSPVDWFKAEQASKNTVLQALRALENKDFVLLADVLEYDLNNVLQMWLDHLRVLEKSLNGEYTGSHIHSEQTGSHPVDRKRLAN